MNQSSEPPRQQEDTRRRVETLRREGLLEVQRSARRRKTVSARRQGDKVVIAIPAHFSRRTEEEWVHRIVAQLDRKSARLPPSDEDLLRRARALSERYLGGRAVPAGVSWVTNQNTIWGSTTSASGRIRLSHRLRSMPEWVADYVLVHELAHLLRPDHGREFWSLVSAYPHVERAQAYLEGFTAGAESSGQPSPTPGPS